MVCESSCPYDGLEVPSVLSDSIYYSSPQSIPVSHFLPVLGNASSSLPPGIYPCSLLCLEHLSPMNLPAPSFFPVLSREAIPDHAGCNSSFSHTALPIIFCLIFLQSTYSLYCIFAFTNGSFPFVIFIFQVVTFSFLLREVPLTFLVKLVSWC